MSKIFRAIQYAKNHNRLYFDVDINADIPQKNQTTQESIDSGVYIQEIGN